MTFHKDMISIEPFKPHSYAEIEDVYPPGAMPELAYQQYVKKVEALEDVNVYRIAYKSNGLKVYGLMGLPANLQDGQHPLMLYNRGGFKHYGMLTAHSVMRDFVPYAREGYICFASYYRGNDGGEGEDHFGGDDVDDVLNLLQIAKSHPAWDKQNSYIIGHSRGGMMTLRALQQGADVNVAVCIASLTDLTIGGEEDWRGFLKYLPKEEQANPEAMLKKRSGAHFANQLDTPLLILHGDADNVVPHEHSERLFAALGDAEKHKLIIYPGGNHALIRQWDEVVNECKRWMADHAA